MTLYKPLLLWPSLTRNSNKTTIQVMPSVPSPMLISLMCTTNWSQKPMNELDLMLMPRRSFNWDVAMTIAAADVKPAETGPDMKSIKNPKTPQYVTICYNTRITNGQYTCRLPWVDDTRKTPQRTLTCVICIHVTKRRSNGFY